jgi:NAD(P)-dependent dehydrogenase (short-subunit alcohol dehydrogenase family)
VLDLGIAGKVAVVTGGSAGIGLACARLLAQEGARVVLAARGSERLKAACASIAEATPSACPLAISADLSTVAGVDRVVTEAAAGFGRIDILINNAGATRAGKFSELTDDDFTGGWDLKLLGYIRMTRAVIPHMRGGSIVNIIGGGAKSPSATFLPGGTANAAVLNFTKGIAKELAADGVRVNAVSPGSTATERTIRLLEQEAAARGIPVPDMRAQRMAEIPLGRLVSPDEVARLAVLLSSDLFPSMTGTEIVIDGGRASWL